VSASPKLHVPILTRADDAGRNRQDGPHRTPRGPRHHRQSDSAKDRCGNGQPPDQSAPRQVAPADLRAHLQRQPFLKIEALPLGERVRLRHGHTLRPAADSKLAVAAIRPDRTVVELALERRCAFGLDVRS